MEESEMKFEMMKFSEIHYHRPDPERLRAELRELIEQLKNASN